MITAVKENARGGGKSTSGLRIGQALLAAGKLTLQDTVRVLRVQAEKGMRFGDVALRLGLVTESDIRQILAHQFDYPYLEEGQGQYGPRLLAAYRPFCTQMEALRSVRSQLLMNWFSRGQQALAVVGMRPEDDTPLLCANLAIAFAQLGKKTLLVDANLRQPGQHQLFKLPAVHGFSDVLAGRADWDIISEIQPFHALSVLQTGTIPPNPPELLCRPTFDTLIRELRGRFEVILFDAPSFSTAMDYLSIGAQAGGVLIVATRNRTGWYEIRELKERLVRAGVAITGAVLIEPTSEGIHEA